MCFLGGGRSFLRFAEALALPQRKNLLDVCVGSLVFSLVGDLGDGFPANETLRVELLALSELLVEDVLDGYPQLGGGRQLGGGDERNPHSIELAADDLRADAVVRAILPVALVHFLDLDAVLSGTGHLVISCGQHISHALLLAFFLVLSVLCVVLRPTTGRRC